MIFDQMRCISQIFPCLLFGSKGTIRTKIHILIIKNFPNPITTPILDYTEVQHKKILAVLPL